MGMWRWAAVAWLALGGAAAAQQGPEQPVIAELARQGYVEFEVSRTLLGRIRVVALGPGGERREIVFNPATGEVLRDLVEGAGQPRLLERPAGEAVAAQPAPAPEAPAEGSEPGEAAAEAEEPEGSEEGGSDAESDGEEPGDADDDESDSGEPDRDKSDGDRSDGGSGGRSQGEVAAPGPEEARGGGAKGG